MKHDKLTPNAYRHATIKYRQHGGKTPHIPDLGAEWRWELNLCSACLIQWLYNNAYVCMYVYAYVCMYVCMYMYVCMCMYVFIKLSVAQIWPVSTQTNDNYRIIQWKGCESSVYGPIRGTITAFVWRAWGKLRIITVRIARIRACIRERDLLLTSDHTTETLDTSSDIC